MLNLRTVYTSVFYVPVFHNVPALSLCNVSVLLSFSLCFFNYIIINLSSIVLCFLGNFFLYIPAMYFLGSSCMCSLNCMYTGVCSKISPLFTQSLLLSIGTLIHIRVLWPLTSVILDVLNFLYCLSKDISWTEGIWQSFSLVLLAVCMCVPLCSLCVYCMFAVDVCVWPCMCPSVLFMFVFVCLCVCACF